MFSRPIAPPFNNIHLIENAFIENKHYNNIQQNNNVIANESNKILKGVTFYKNNIRLEKYKISELREILKFYKSSISFIRNDRYSCSQIQMIKTKYDFLLTGKKEDLIRRIKCFFEKEYSAIKIQKLFRTHIVKMDIQLRGPALKNRSLCVNDSDFYTLDSLKSIPLERFFSYKGEGDFIYGFDLDSLITLIKNSKNVKLINPYNRESMSSIITSIQLVIRTNNILRNKELVLKNNTIQSTNISSNGSYNPGVVIEELRTIREKPLNQRITNLFIEIDQLGNYTQSAWFSDLNRNDTIRYFRCLYDIWNYRAQLSIQVKLKICPLLDPFANLPFSMNQIFTLSDDQIKILALFVMENMILTGIDNDHKMIGTLHVLTALTVVSTNARSNLPWLYESLVF